MLPRREGVGTRSGAEQEQGSSVQPLLGSKGPGFACVSLSLLANPHPCERVPETALGFTSSLGHLKKGKEKG